ncbi:helix-turn-helix transcriptional regulator [Phytoactinopolyspora halophila]|uniref:helix-turn-helix transcriptional regulator n=1 Tax=Phytoactinopolyspora halophila TaxID=1981511 RepID=UPI001B8ADBB7|nr:LuxR family transcriptional regulator [Phytoactinopolyspora halophila]
MSRIGSYFPLVARHHELTQLRDALARAQSGRATSLLVSGEAGVGKSRLLAELADHAPTTGAHVLVGRCVDISEAGFPYLPFTEIIEQLRAIDPGALPARPGLATLVGSASPAPSRAATAAASAAEDIGPNAAHQFDQLQLFDAVLGALTDLSEDACVVVQIEDLHWSDPSTRDLLSFLLSRLGGQRLLIVASYRSDELHRRHPLRPMLAELVRLPAVERLDIQPFRREDTERFIRTIASEDVDDATIADIARRCEGNAFFAEELVTANSTSPQDGIPTVLAEVLLAKVEKLSTTAQRAVRALAVSGNWHVRHTTLEAVIGIDPAELDAALREAMQHNIIVTDVKDAYTFRHALLREAIYADLLPGERTRLHAAYAASVADSGVAGMAAALAYHSMRANDLPTALHASVQAAKEARAKGAAGAELQHIERALELWQAVDDAEANAGKSELALNRRAAYAAGSAGLPDRALAYMRTAIPLADANHDPVLAADTRRQLTQALLDNSHWTEAEQVINEAWELIKDCPTSKERAWVLSIRTRVTVIDEERRSIAEAAAAEARASGTASAEADALISLAFADDRDGRTESAARLLERARQLAVEAGALDVELRAWFNLVFSRFDHGELDAAAQIADEGVQRAAELGLTWSLYGRRVRMLQALAHYARGDWDAAAEAAAPPGETVSDLVSAMLTVAGAMVHVGRGQFDQAELTLERLRPEWYRNEDEQIANLAAAASAELACWQGRPDTAAELVEEALRSLPALSGEQWPLGGIRLAAIGLQALADRAHSTAPPDPSTTRDATDAGDALLQHAEQTAVHGVPRTADLGPEGRAWLMRARAEHGRLHGTRDPDSWQAVIDAFGYGDVYQQAIARWRLAETLIAAGRRDDAAIPLEAAASVADQLEARPLGDAVRALAHRARITLPGAPAASMQILTSREASVLSLVAQGMTNRAAGQKLFISEKTVSVHLSRVMSKLGAASRTEAVALAYQRGLLDESVTQ